MIPLKIQIGEIYDIFVKISKDVTKDMNNGAMANDLTVSTKIMNFSFIVLLLFGIKY